MPKISPTLKVLVEIRDTLRAHDEKLSALDTNLSALGKRQVETEIRLATELVTVAKVMGEVRDLLRDRFDQRDRVDDIDRRLTALERRAS